MFTNQRDVPNQRDASNKRKKSQLEKTSQRIGIAVGGGEPVEDVSGIHHLGGPKRDPLVLQHSKGLSNVDGLPVTPASDTSLELVDQEIPRAKVGYVAIVDVVEGHGAPWHASHMGQLRSRNLVSI
jgi:hypothetical protein